MTIEELKRKVGENAKNIIADDLGLQIRNGKCKCPNRSAHKNSDKNPSMAWHKDGLQFHCFACEEKIDIYTYYTKYKGLAHKEVMEIYEDKADLDPLADFQWDSVPEEVKAEFHLSELTEKQMNYLTNVRGLSSETIDHFGLGSIGANIGIPYINQDGITGIKIKNMGFTGPKYYSVPGSEFGLLNKDQLNFSDPLIITEGEFDSMAVYEAGFQNVCSVGTGGSSLEKLINQEKDYLSKFKALIILGDNDEVGQKMKRTFMEQFGYLVKLPNPDKFLGSKDANEVLLRHGPEQLKHIIESAAVKIEGLRDLDNRPYEGIRALEGKYIPTGIPTLDYSINDLGPGQVTLITGRSNGGKSTFVNQIMINAIDKENRVLLIAGEGVQTMLINNLYKGVIGKNSEFYDTVRVNKRHFIEPKPFVLEALQKWHKSKLTIFSKGESKLKTTDELFNLINMEIKLKHPNLIVIDNLMSTISIEKVSEKWEKQADFVQRCCDLSKSENVHIIIVLHPNKTVRKHSSMDFEDISGGSDIYNKADIILSVKRNYDEDKENSGEIQILKNRYFSDLPKVETVFQKSTGMLLEETEDGLIIDYILSWKKYLDPKKIENQVDQYQQDEIEMFPVSLEDLENIPF